MEQALVFASIIVGVAVSDQVMSLNRLLRAPRVRWHWTIPVVALQVLLTNLQIWWGIAGQPETRISIGQFLPFVVELILLALLSAASLPDSVPEDGIDLKEYYDRSARYIWLLFASALVWLQGYELFRTLNGGGSASDWLATRGGDLVALAIMLMLAFVRRWYLVAVGLAFLSIGPIGWLSRTLG